MTNFPKQIREWYMLHGRRLPWRETKDPYKIWISEVILQQTRVGQGLEYFRRFVTAFPNVKALAESSETQLMQQWQGLGYYSRARNLQHAAQTIVTEHNGNIPQTYKKIRTLKGIGPYTAAAIASFAFNLPYAVVDGNVYRILSRLYATDIPIDSSQGQKHFAILAGELLDRQDPATHNQAIMDLGALICKPINPLCEECPVNQICAAYATGTQKNFPVKEKKIKRRKRYLNFLVLKSSTHIIISKRTGKDIWQGLYQFPLIETPEPFTGKEIRELLKTSFKKTFELTPILEKKHLLTHQELHVRFFKITLPREVDLLYPENIFSGEGWLNSSDSNLKMGQNIIAHEARAWAYIKPEAIYQKVPIEKIEDVPFPQIIKENLEKLITCE
jgi:A/G-specific adenine glycosylase